MNAKPEFSERRSWTRFNDRAIFGAITLPAVSSNDFFYAHRFRWTKAKSLTALAGLILAISSTVRADWTSLNPGILGVDNSVYRFAVDDRGNMYVGGSFNVAGTLPANFIAKWDGTAWSALGSGMDGAVYALAVSGTNLYAGGSFTNAGGVSARYIARWDGYKWSALGSGSDSVVGALAVSGTNLYAGGSFTNAGGVSAKYVARWDGYKWSALGSGMNSGVGALAVSGTNLYAGGSFTNAGGVSARYVARWDGNAWSALGSGLGGSLAYVRALVASGTNLYAGGSFTSAGGVSAVGVAKWDGTAWSSLGTGLGDPGDYTGTSISTLTVSGTNLYAGGYLRPPGDNMIHNGVAEWDGSAWRILGYVNNNGVVNALVVNGTNLFAGGSLESIDSGVGTTTALHIAQWNGSTWAPLISGVNARVAALAVNGDEVYAGGDFTHLPDGVTANYIAKWDGNTWSSLGLGMNGPVRALGVNGADLYVGGTFTKTGDMPVNYIAKWDGHKWSTLDSGLDGPVYALGVNGSNLYAGGAFTHAGGVPTQYVAKWDGHAWSALGSGVDGSVLALAVNGTNLYAAGNFASVAQWDGNTWSPLTTFLDGSVYALAVNGTDLYIGGNFSRVGVDIARYIAKWDGNAWSALGSWTGTPIIALAVDGTNLYAGGQAYSPGPYGVNKWDGNSWLSMGMVSGPGSYNTDVEALAADGRGHLFVGGNYYLADAITSPFIARMSLPGVPTILKPPQSQTAEAGSTVNIILDASGYPAVTCFWFFNETNLVACSTNCWLKLSNCDYSQSGVYTVVVSNALGVVTSAPVMLNVIPSVERRPVPGIELAGEIGSLLNVEYTDILGAPTNWLPLDTVSLTNPPEYCFDVTMPFPPTRFYRAWQIGTPSVTPSLSLPGLVPAITLTGSIGNSLRLDCINQIGPTDAWVTLDTVTLTNTSQLYFDTSAVGQPVRLYRIVPVP
jgi:hypothetical protein